MKEAVLRRGDRVPPRDHCDIPHDHCDGQPATRTYKPCTIHSYQDRVGVIRYIELAPVVGGGAREQRALFPN